jgi:hypothetical protein
LGILIHSFNQSFPSAENAPQKGNKRKSGNQNADGNQHNKGPSLQFQTTFCQINGRGMDEQQMNAPPPLD